MTTKRYYSNKEQRYQTQFEKVCPVGKKILKAMSKHRADHSNPGGVVSEYFRQKRSKI